MNLAEVRKLAKEQRGLFATRRISAADERRYADLPFRNHQERATRGWYLRLFCGTDPCADGYMSDDDRGPFASEREALEYLLEPDA